jgi:hypothetical protein
MAKNPSKDNPTHNNNTGGNNAPTVTACIAESCKKKPEIAGFCQEHFVWFKEGMITKMGKKPSDFDKKFISYMKRTQNKKAA